MQGGPRLVLHFFLHREEKKRAVLQTSSRGEDELMCHDYFCIFSPDEIEVYNKLAG